MKIRIATTQDAELLARLGYKTFSQAFRDMNNRADFDAYVSRAFALDTVLAELADECAEFFLAFAEDEPVGYFKMYEGQAPEVVAGRPAVEIARFYSLKKWWDRGAGSFMMGKCLDHSQKKGFVGVWLSSWKKNDRGNGFYSKWGFEAVGEKTFTIGNDVQQDYILARSIEPLSP